MVRVGATFWCIARAAQCCRLGDHMKHLLLASFTTAAAAFGAANAQGRVLAHWTPIDLVHSNQGQLLAVQSFAIF